MDTPERCLRCDWWGHAVGKCTRVLKGRLLIGHNSGELDIETAPGLIPEHLSDEFEAWLAEAISTAVDSYPGWPEIEKLRNQNGGCAGEKKSQVIKQFGSHLALAKPLVAHPEKNLDARGLFKADISLW